MTLTIAKQSTQLIEKGVWEMASDYLHCDSCGHTIIKYDGYLKFPKQKGALCIDCAAPKVRQ